MFKKTWFLPLITVIFGTAILSLTMIRSGTVYSYGMGFWGPNGHDAVWHLSLINQLKNNVPPLNPIFSGQTLSNYHWGFDLFAALISKLFFIAPVTVYFKILPILFGLSIGFLSYYLGKKTTGNEAASIIFSFLSFFAGSFGWIYTLITEGHIAGESLFWSMQSASTLLNPPYALSIILLLIGLILWLKHKNSNSFAFGIIDGLLFGFLAIIKVYAALLIGLSLLFYFIFNYLKTRKIAIYNLTVWLTVAMVSAILLFYLGALKSSGLLEFRPLWFEHSMIESIDKFYLPKLASLRMNLASNIFTVKLPLLLAIEFTLLCIFIVGNMGTRIFGIFPIIRKIINRNLSDFEVLILTLMIFSFVIPNIFVQKGTAWNTIQFFYYFLFFANFFLALHLSSLLHSEKLKNNLLVLLLLVLTVMTSYSTIKDYLGNPPPAAIPQYELDALNFLKTQKGGTVLTYPYDRFKKDSLGLKTPIPVYLYETTAYVSALTGDQTYIEDEMNADITGFDWKSRREESLKFFSSTDPYFSRGFLLNNNIDYIYLVNDQNFRLQTGDIYVTRIFDNGFVRIFKVQK